MDLLPLRVTTYIQHVVYGARGVAHLAGWPAVHQADADGPSGTVVRVWNWYACSRALERISERESKRSVRDEWRDVRVSPKAKRGEMVASSL